MRFAKTVLSAATAIVALASAPATAAPVNRDVLHVQVLLDSLGFGPGVLDGRGGPSLVAALKGFQESRGLAITGKPDPATLRALYPYRGKRPTTAVTLTPEMLSGQFRPLPDDYAEKAKMSWLGYATPMEKLAEMFHTTEATLIALNSPDTRIAVGVRIVVPNALPASRAYPQAMPADWHRTLGMLNVDARSPHGQSIEVDKSDGVLRVLDGQGRLVAQFTATMGSSHDPLPLGEWKIYGADYNPQFKYNPKLFWDADRSDKAQMLPPGPNGPVGVVWMDLSKEHYGIHGTPSPETIGRAESHGCIRLTNWDAARLTLMVPKGAKAVFKA